MSERIDNRENKIPFSKFSVNDIINFLIPCMLKALLYLQYRDIDNDGLLEQKHNEDWMDTTLRIGKVVYSQACWILALKNFSILLRKTGNKKESKRLEEMAARAILAVEDKMWSAKDGCYIDLLDSNLHLDKKMHNRLVTQDISLYLVALTEDSIEASYNHEDNVNLKEYSKCKSYTNNINLDTYQHALRYSENFKEKNMEK